MFYDEDLINHIQSSNSIKVDSLIIAEWNQNILSNIDDYGSYRWRPNTASSTYANLINTYDPDDSLNFYTNSLESKSISEYRTDDPNEPLVFLNDEQEMQLYYSLKDCFTPFRPRSGINKILFFNGAYVDSIRSAKRPRYYFSSRKDQFKYWTSYRKDSGLEVGVSNVPRSGSVSLGYAIDDSVPFVVYKQPVATNRIVVKMQTNIADQEVLGLDRQEVVPGQIRVGNSVIADPLSRDSNSTIPKKWKIQYLDSENNWNDAISFDQNSTRSDGQDVVGWDGYVELYYGVKIPDEYRDSFNFIDYLSASTQLPLNVINGQSYIIGASETSAGTLYIWDTSSQQWIISQAEYGFSLLEENDTKRFGLIKKLVSPDYFTSGGDVVYRDLVFLKGLRVVVETMANTNKTFNLIELSPRLKVDLTNYTIDYSVDKQLAATDYGLPVGGLAAGNGNINLSNYDGAFSELNQDSIIYNNLKPQVKFDFYETVLDVNGYDKFIPIKTLYSESAMSSTTPLNDVSLSLRDLFFRFESAKAPSVFVRNCTLTSAISIMLDNIGFGNYIFKGISSANDPVIPYFFVEPDSSVAEILERLARSTQTAMFFDEYNNFVVMPKEYILPDLTILDSNEAISERMLTLYGQKSGSIVPNIENISKSDTTIINDGQINYTTRYIQRKVTKLENAQNPSSKDRQYNYTQSILWEGGEQDNVRTTNQSLQKSSLLLCAATLNTNLSDVVPYVENGQIKSNILDLSSDSLEFLSRFQGYFYANGEIIRYDAQEFSVSGFGNVWISDNNDYQKYFSKLPFNGSIWPTGRLRIFSEPFYEELSGANVPGLEAGVVYKNGAVKSHGRGQFGTSIVNHYAGLSEYWKDINNRKSFRMDSKYIFSRTPTDLIAYPVLGADLNTSIGADQDSKLKSEITDKVVSFLRKNSRTENNSIAANQTEATVQSSALVFSGPRTFTPAPSGLTSTSARDVVTYVYKDFSNDYKHVGTRMRIIGDSSNSPTGATTYFDTNSTNSQSSQISGSSGGIGYMIDKNTNSGYYFEISALTDQIVSGYKNSASVSVGAPAQNEVIHNVIFYKVLNKTTATPESGKENIAIPVKLWGMSIDLLTDLGIVGQDRLGAESKPTVYDLAVESETLYKDASAGGGVDFVKFYLYINNVLVATVIDKNPLPSISTNSSFTSCLFIRASSKCMFEYFYALKNRINQSNAVTVATSSNGGINSQNNALMNLVDNNISVSESLRKYAMSGMVQSTYLSSISSEKPPQYSMYFEEFGTILRECLYFNIKYDQAYPALTAKFYPYWLMSPEKSFVISGFIPGSYGAEFLVFNSTDRNIDMSDSSINKLVLYGVTFTQNISNVLTVDDYFRQISNFSDPFVSNSVISSPGRAEKIYQDIKDSRSIYGNKAFTLSSPYIQNEDSAISLMKWIVGKTLKPRNILEISAFAIPHVQIGDIVKIDYILPDGDRIVDENKRFVVISVNYKRSYSDIVSQIRLLEV